MLECTTCQGTGVNEAYPQSEWPYCEYCKGTGREPRSTLTSQQIPTGFPHQSWNPGCGGSVEDLPRWQRISEDTELRAEEEADRAEIAFLDREDS